MARTTLPKTEADRRELEERWQAERRFAAEYGLTMEEREAFAGKEDAELEAEIEEMRDRMTLLESHIAYAETRQRAVAFEAAVRTAGSIFDKQVTRVHPNTHNLRELADLYQVTAPAFIEAVRERFGAVSPPAECHPDVQVQTVRAEIEALKQANLLRRKELEARAAQRGN